MNQFEDTVQAEEIKTIQFPKSHSQLTRDEIFKMSTEEIKNRITKLERQITRFKAELLVREE